jgi:quercetin dioxygenase-like cupin family protein
MSDNAQTPTISHLQADSFKHKGLREYAVYRDLGFEGPSAGAVQAHVIRFIPPCTDEVRKRHYHDIQIQIAYVMKGWLKIEIEGMGIQTLNAGSCLWMPPKVLHTVLDFSDDAEVLEINSPADFATVNV